MSLFKNGLTRGRSWFSRCASRVAALVGAVLEGEDGRDGPWCRDRTVSCVGWFELFKEVDDGERRGCNATNATKGYVVACNFSAAM